MAGYCATCKGDSRPLTDLSKDHEISETCVDNADSHVETLDHLMDEQVATIWVKAGQAKKHSIKIGGVYREQHQLGSKDKDS